MAYAFIGSAKAGAGTVGSGSDHTGTSPALDTTGATLLVAWVSRYAAGAPVPSDSKSNTWVALTDRVSGASNSAGKLYYVATPTVGTGHTFQADAGSSYPGIVVMAFSGSLASTPLDQQGGNTTLGNTSLTSGSVTPSENDELVIIGKSGQATGLPTINGGFSSPVVGTDFGGNNYSAHMSYLIQTTAAAANPTWTFDSSQEAAIGGATFKAAGGGGGGAPSYPGYYGGGSGW